MFAECLSDARTLIYTEVATTTATIMRDEYTNNEGHRPGIVGPHREAEMRLGEASWDLRTRSKLLGEDLEQGAWEEGPAEHRPQCRENSGLEEPVEEKAGQNCLERRCFMQCLADCICCFQKCDRKLLKSKVPGSSLVGRNPKVTVGCPWCQSMADHCV